MPNKFEYHIKWTQAGKGATLYSVDEVIAWARIIMKDRELGMGAGKVIITQRRMPEGG